MGPPEGLIRHWRFYQPGLYVKCQHRVIAQDLEHNGRHWHAACFHCSDCNQSLAELEFAIRDDKLYCAECHENNFAPRCDHCKQVFRTGPSMQPATREALCFHVVRPSVRACVRVRACLRIRADAFSDL